jgi:hypothetical protein
LVVLLECPTLNVHYHQNCHDPSPLLLSSIARKKFINGSGGEFNIGAGERIRTADLFLGKEAF